MIWHDRDRCKQEVEKLLPYIDFMKISDEELYFVGGEDNIEAFMKEHGITVLIETLGSKELAISFMETVMSQQAGR